MGNCDTLVLLSHVFIVFSWCLSYNNVDKDEYRDVVERIADSKEEIRMAKETLIHVSQDDHERARNRSRRKWQTDYESDMNTSRAVGREEGREEVAIEIARKMLEANMPIDAIVSLSGLTREEVEGLFSTAGD